MNKIIIMDLSIVEGRYLVETARKAIVYYLENFVPMKAPPVSYPKLKEKKGIFCTLLKYPDGELRGCIGLVNPDTDLVNATIEASCSAIKDPRFYPLKEDELDKITIELSVLGDFEKILVYEPRDYLNQIKIGEDGLFLKYHLYSALFLPQVPVEHNWDVKTYLSQICRKAGLREGAWLNKAIKLYKFKTQVFYESEPSGEVYEKKISG